MGDIFYHMSRIVHGIVNFLLKIYLYNSMLYFPIHLTARSTVHTVTVGANGITVVVHKCPSPKQNTYQP